MVDVPVFKRKTTVDPVAPTFVRSIDLLVTRDIMEYPVVDVSFAYLASIDKLERVVRGTTTIQALVTIDDFDDLACEGFSSGDMSIVIGRYQGIQDHYGILQYSPATTADFILQKQVAGAFTDLGYEAVDLGSNEGFLVKIACKGTTISAYRDDMVTPKISVTDTSFAKGRFGITWARLGTIEIEPATVYLRKALSPSPRVLGYFEVPIIGEGTIENPFHPKMPEEIIDHPEFGKVNRSALSWGTLIKSDRKTGKPKEYIAIVRILEQPIRQEHLYDIPKCISALEAMSGVTRLKREEAIKRALKLDDKLTEKDVKDW